MTADERFHKHLDECRQCREEPFNLCPLGDAFIMQAGAELVVELMDKGHFREGFINDNTL